MNEILLIFNFYSTVHFVGYKAGTRKGGCSGKKGFFFSLYQKGTHSDLKTALQECLIDEKCKGVWDKGGGDVHSCMTMKVEEHPLVFRRGEKYAKGKS